MSKFTFIDFFSGIGGFHIGLTNAGGKSVGYSEIDKKAIETYVANFPSSSDKPLGDITKITELPEVDMIVGGVPCQSWSVAGKKRGFDDPRGKLWYDAILMVKKAKPKVFIFENVKGLADPRNKDNLLLIKESLEAEGYIVRHQLLNSFDFNVPQNRTRIFIVGFRKDQIKYSDKFQYPTPQKDNGKQLVDYLEGVNKQAYAKIKYRPEEIHGKFIPKARNAFQLEDELNDFFIFCDTRNGHSTVHSWDLYETTRREKNICMLILRNRRKKIYGPGDGNPLSFEDLQQLLPDLKIEELEALVDKRILRRSKFSPEKYEFLNSKNSSGIDGIYRVFLPNSKIFSTLTATGTKDYVATDYVKNSKPSDYKQDFIKQIVRKNKIRPITKYEAGVIQGFPSKFICHENDRYAQKQFGNAVSPPVVEALAKSIVKTGIFD